jgi:hypothetical protein
MLSASRLAIAMKAAAVTLVLALATLTWAQSANSHPAQTVPKSQSTSSARKWLTPKEQLWCPVLESALGGAAAADPPMRSYLLNAVAAGLSKCEPGKVRTALVDSFAATLAMPENEDIWQRVASQGSRLDQETREALYKLETKQRLQEVALTQLLSVDELKAESLLPQSEPEVRADLVGSMVSHKTAAKKFDRAISLLSRFVSDDRFPYSEATELMLALPPTRDADRQDIFRLAMASDSKSHSFSVEGDDFAGMIVRFWQHIPPALVLDAIHQVLDAASSGHGTGVTLNGASGLVGFTSDRDFRVFELLPVLRQLDDEEADKILKDSQQAQLQLKQFPNGIQSLDPTIRDTPAQEGEQRGLTRGSTGPPDQMLQLLEKSQARAKEIGRSAEDNPRQAIAAAASLPESVPFGSKGAELEFFPRAEAYVAIARTAMKKNPSAARDALEEMAASLKDAAHPYHALEHWGEGMTIAKEMGELELAVKLFRSGMEQVDKLKNEDTDSDDPNLALKAWWPSVWAYWWLVKAAAQFSPHTALEQVRAIKDPEIVAVLEVKLADNGLGARAEESITMVNKKLSARNSWSEFRAPEK